MRTVRLADKSITPSDVCRVVRFLHPSSKTAVLMFQPAEHDINVSSIVNKSRRRYRVLLLCKRIFDFYRNGIHATLSDGKHNNI